MRTVTELLKQKGKVVVYCSSDGISRLFLKNAESEGFTIGGESAEGNELSDLYSIGRDLSISCPGYAGHMAFRTEGWISPVPVTYVDYGKFITGQRRYVIKRVRASKRLAAGKQRSIFGIKLKGRDRA